MRKLLLLAVAFSLPAFAQQEFPDRGPLEMTVLFPAGSSASTCWW